MPGKTFVVPAVPESINSTELPKFLAVVCLYIEKPPLSLGRSALRPSTCHHGHVAVIAMMPLFRNLQVRNGFRTRPARLRAPARRQKTLTMTMIYPKAPDVRR